MPKPVLTRPNAAVGMAQVNQRRVHGRVSTVSGVAGADIWPVGELDPADAVGAAMAAAAGSISRRRLPLSSRIAMRAPEGRRARRSLPNGDGAEPASSARAARAMA